MGGWFRIVAAAVAMSAAVGGAAAQSPFPSKPVHIFVPYAAGGGVDILARTLGDVVSRQWGQTVVVENRPGAGGVVGGISLVWGISVPGSIELPFYKLRCAQVSTTSDSLANVWPVGRLAPAKQALGCERRARRHRPDPWTPAGPATASASCRGRWRRPASGRGSRCPRCNSSRSPSG